MDERRTAWLLIVVLIVQLALLAAQLPAQGTGSNGSLLGQIALLVVAPIPNFVSWVLSYGEGAADGLKRRETLQAENTALNQQVEELQKELFHLRGVERELEGLAEILDYSPLQRGDLRPADVVYLDQRSWLRTLVIQTGRQAAEPDQPVVVPDGLVGRVVQAAGSYAKVQLVTDRAAAVGAMIERTRRQAMLRGVDRHELELDFLPLQASVEIGDRLITSGTDGIYPRGIPVGTVTLVEPGGELFHRVVVEPAVDFGTMSQVYLLRASEIPESIRKELPGARP